MNFRILTAETKIIALLMLVIGALVASAPMEILVDRFMPDDAFYYFETARRFANGEGSTFDGIGYTNGYQPLWLLLCTAVFATFPLGGELPVRLLLLLQGVIAAAAASAYLIFARFYLSRLGAALATAAFIYLTHRILFNGLETPLSLATTFIAFGLLHHAAAAGDNDSTHRWTSWAGFCMGIAFLARTDTGIYAALAAAFIFVRTWQKTHLVNAIERFVAFSLPVGAVAFPYLAMNLLVTGHMMPVSGAAKVFHSESAKAAIGTGGDAYIAVLKNALWAFQPNISINLFLGILLPILLLLIGIRDSGKERPRSLGVLLIIWMGSVATYLFYGVVFFGGLSQASWYFGISNGLSAISAILLAESIAESRDGPLLAFPVLATLSVLASLGFLGWWVGIGLISFLLLLMVVVKIVNPERRCIDSSAKENISLIVIAFAACAAFLLYGIFREGASMMKYFMAATFALAALQVLGLAYMKWFSAGPSSIRFMATCQFLVTMAGLATVAALNLRSDLTSPAAGWNANLYRGAAWASTFTSPGSILWSGSSGILGYFSNRTTVNTDGLINSFEFLERVLKKNKLGEYVSQFDFAIDAFAERPHKTYWPSGCFITLQPPYQGAEFADGTAKRILGIYQMNERAVIDCRQQVQ